MDSGPRLEIPDPDRGQIIPTRCLNKAKGGSGIKSKFCHWLPLGICHVAMFRSPEQAGRGRRQRPSAWLCAA